MRSRSRSAATAGLIALATFGIVLGAFVFAQSDQASRVADDAIRHARLQEAAASSASARADVVISLAAESDAVRDAALEDAAIRMSGLSTFDVPPAVTAEIRRITADLEAFSDALRVEGPEAVDPWGVRLIDDLGDLAGSLASEAIGLERAIRAESTAAGDTARAASVVVALIAPALAVFVLHRANHARVRRLQLTATLERERAISAVQTHLISGLSHELRTPLTGIAGFAEALLECGASDPGLTEEAGRIIYTESNELRRMIEDMLVASRANTGTLEYSERAVDARTEIEAVIDPFLKSGFSIRLDIEPATWQVDRLRVRHILRNLVSNSVKHGRDPVAIEGRQTGGRYLVSVLDHGDGFDGVDLDRIRAGFVHEGDAATVEGSVGLGFAVATALAEGMGSTLDIARIDDTTSVTLTVPMSARTVAPVG